jgi:hypothetical protein
MMVDSSGEPHENRKNEQRSNLKDQPKIPNQAIGNEGTELSAGAHCGASASTSCGVAF